MKKQMSKSKWRTYCWSFCFNSGEERKAIQPTWRLFRIGFYYYPVSRTSHSASGFPTLFRVFTTRRDRCSGSAKFFARRGQSKKFQHFRSQMFKSSLNSRCNVKGKISGGIKGFSGLFKASIGWAKILLEFHLLLTLSVLQTVVYLIRQN